MPSPVSLQFGVILHTPRARIQLNGQRICGEYKSSIISYASEIQLGARLIKVAKTFSYFPIQINCSWSASGETPTTCTIVFIKGLALSTSEGNLKRAFSEIGEVSKVKIVSDKRTEESLGFAYVWYANEESAHLAVQEMNGKFFEGRFINVAIARPGSCKIPRRATPYKF